MSPVVIKGLWTGSFRPVNRVVLTIPGACDGMLRLTKVSQDHVWSDLILFPSWGLWNTLGQGRRLPYALMGVRKDHFLHPWVHTSTV